jgi:hypothetical protein
MNSSLEHRCGIWNVDDLSILTTSRNNTRNVFTGAESKLDETGYFAQFEVGRRRRGTGSQQQQRIADTFERHSPRGGI